MWAFIWQLAVVLGLSASVAFFVGVKIYLFGSIVTFVITAAMLFGTPGRHSDEIDWADLFITFAISIAFAALWPGVPLALTYGGRRLAADAQTREEGAASSQRAPSRERRKSEAE